MKPSRKMASVSAAFVLASALYIWLAAEYGTPVAVYVLLSVMAAGWIVVGIFFEFRDKSRRH
jgi:hypothetical protein